MDQLFQFFKEVTGTFSTGGFSWIEAVTEVLERDHELTVVPVEHPSPPIKADTLTVYVDGGSEGGGAASHGYGSFQAFTPNGNPYTPKNTYHFSSVTSPEAEYLALIQALNHFAGSEYRLVILMDSELILKQMKGEYKVRAENLRPLYAEAKRMQEYITDIQFKWIHNSEMKKVLGH